MKVAIQNHTRSRDHEQVPFITLDGEEVEVDKGLRPLLILLREHGVRTQFSCEGHHKTEEAYVLADWRSFMRLMRRIRKAYRKGQLSEESAVVVRRFIKGYRDFDLVRFENRKKPEHLTSRRLIRVIWGYPGSPYTIERSYDNHFGRRITLRWPKHVTPDIVNLLLEVW